MTRQELQERITKKQNEIAKKEKNLVKYIVDDEFTAMCDRYFQTGNRTELNQYKQQHNLFCLPEYYSKRYDLEEAKKTLVKYQNMLAVEEQKENSLNELPELFNELQQMLIKSWDEFDMARRDEIKQAIKELNQLPYGLEWKEQNRKLSNKYGYLFREKASETDEHIHQQNIKDSKNIILDLVNRVSAKTGKITSYANLHLDQNNQGFLILNGYVIGENGTANVESILAGGYNIQRLHIRVLVK